LLDDAEAAASAKKVIFCSGKIYYQLITRRQQISALDTAIVRVEMLHPFPEKAIRAVIGRYKKATAWIWVQEEPENMGAWQFMRPRMDALLQKPLVYVGRNASASPATGFPKIYKIEQDGLVDRAIGSHNQAEGMAG
jgi:2-oxoglutarate dehydrogenase E1 component